jgi:alpha-D-ribose 1-methylphosphonate 5-triphosphate synthase subunit PhnI
MLDFLKNVPDMTNTPEITMHDEPAPKKPLTKRIRAYKAEHPNATYADIAKALGSTYQYVYTTLNVKTAPKKNVGKQPAEKPINKKEFQQVSEDNEIKQMIIEAQANRIGELTAIIEYLENKIDSLNELKYG